MTQVQAENAVAIVGRTAVATVVVFHAIGKPEFLTAVITFLAGANLISLARAFRCPVCYGTGALLMLWATFIAMFFPGAMMPTLGAMGTATILLGSAAYALTSTGRASLLSRTGSKNRCDALRSAPASGNPAMRSA
jgi:hypothetical protein